VNGSSPWYLVPGGWNWRYGAKNVGPTESSPVQAIVGHGQRGDWTWNGGLGTGVLAMILRSWSLSMKRIIPKEVRR
jgi:hypothetical protein